MRSAIALLAVAKTDDAEFRQKVEYRAWYYRERFGADVKIHWLAGREYWAAFARWLEP